MRTVFVKLLSGSLGVALAAGIAATPAAAASVNRDATRTVVSPGASATVRTWTPTVRIRTSVSRTMAIPAFSNDRTHAA